jgi:hypothetical protein
MAPSSKATEAMLGGDVVLVDGTSLEAAGCNVPDVAASSCPLEEPVIKGLASSSTSDAIDLALAG